MASNTHGNKSEREMASYLDEKKVRDLYPHLKLFIKDICEANAITYDENITVHAEYVSNTKVKQDIILEIEGKKIGISLKMGSGNSCHQEKIEDFVDFIKSKCGATDEICNLWRYFIWADGTLDGSGALDKNADGQIISRIKMQQSYEDKRIDDRRKLQNFLDANKYTLVDRALFSGRHDSDVQFIYHGTYKQGVWLSRGEILEFLTTKVAHSKRAFLAIGGLTFQPWNRSLSGTSEHKRGQLQAKYGSLAKNLKSLMKAKAENIGTAFGELDEFDLTKDMNRNKSNSMWKILLPDVDDYTNYFLVKVSSNQMSKLSGRKVKPKSDAYAIMADIPKSLLQGKEYALDENDIKDFDYTILKETGISIKMKDSRSYTYQKLTRSSFYKAFADMDDTRFWFACLLIYSDDGERYKNDKLLSDMGYTTNEFLQIVSKVIGISHDSNSSDFWDAIRKTSQEKMKAFILADDKLRANIFAGRYWFDAPYYASFFYESGKLNAIGVSDFTITTGSGRTRGNYSIEIKPTRK